jgi:hypothetical protein
MTSEELLELDRKALEAAGRALDEWCGWVGPWGFHPGHAALELVREALAARDHASSDTPGADAQRP